MATKTFVALVVLMLLLVVALSLNLVAILTDYWFLVETTGIQSDIVLKHNTYNYGFWRRCYDTVPDDIPSEDLGGAHNNCILIYGDLLRKSGVNMTSSQELVIYLSLSYIGLTIASAAVLLSTLLILICGNWPANCRGIRKPTLYICSSVLLLLATMAGLAGGICFIAAREVEQEAANTHFGVVTSYGWSFMLDWISNGICFISAFLTLCMLRFSYGEVTIPNKYFYGS